MKVMVISDAAGRGEDAFERMLDGAASGVPDLLQVREKSEPDRMLLSRVRHAVERCGTGTAVLVNGRPDVAAAAGARGVQLPSDGLPLPDVRRAFPAPFLVGVSCHGLDELPRAADGGADFALLSPIYATSGKTPLGAETLDALLLPPHLPVFALGGLTLARIEAWPAERRRRLAGVAGIGLFHGPAEETARVIAALRAL